MAEETKPNILGTMKISSLLLKLGLPMMLSMMVQALYNIVDTAFVGMITKEGVANYGAVVGQKALGNAFPIQMLMVAIGVGLGVGVNALLSKYLGMGDRKKASQVAGNALFFVACCYVVFLIFGLVGVRPYMQMMTEKSDANYEAMVNEGTTYLMICTTMSFGIFGYTVYEKLLQSTGKAMLCTIGQLLGAGINIGLDALFILVFQWGVAGAAWATIIGQVASLLFDAIAHYVANKEIDGSLRYMAPKKDVLLPVLQIGFPAMIMQALMAITTFAVTMEINASPLNDGIKNALSTAYGNYYKVQQFIFFAAFGLNNAIIPVIAFNYGMGSRKRAEEGVKYGLVYTVVTMAIGIVIFEALANPLAKWLSGEGDIANFMVLTLRIIPAGFLFAGSNIAFQGIYQAFGYGGRSLWLSLIRLIAIPLPLFFALMYVPNATSWIWVAFPAGEAVGFIASIPMYRHIYRKTVVHIGETPATQTEGK